MPPTRRRRPPRAARQPRRTTSDHPHNSPKPRQVLRNGSVARSTEARMDPLGALPTDFATTRDALHRLAEDVMSPAQAAVNGDIHFEATPGGFGTPVFGEGRQLRVEGAELVEADRGAEVRRRPIDGADQAAARWLADLFALGDTALRALAAEAPDAEPIRLWPEHFDIATVIERATYGVSPGDAQHDE